MSFATRGLLRECDLDPVPEAFPRDGRNFGAHAVEEMRGIDVRENGRALAAVIHVAQHAITRVAFETILE